MWGGAYDGATHDAGSGGTKCHLTDRHRIGRQAVPGKQDEDADRIAAQHGVSPATVKRAGKRFCVRRFFTPLMFAPICAQI